MLSKQLDLKKAIQYALDGQAILFTGAGFSYKAKNVAGEDFPLGDVLRKELAKEVGQATTQANLQNVAQYYISIKGKRSLIDFLKQKFTLKAATADHVTAMSVPWKRVYTTNYDLLAEMVSNQQGLPLETITLSSEYIRPASRKVCVHLNGALTNLTENTLMREFKLTDASYDAEELRGHPWFDFMEDDFKSAKAIIVVGFSKQGDIDISRILALPAFKEKIVFITKKDIDEIDKANLLLIGNVQTIELSGLAKNIKKIRRTYISSPVNNIGFSSFLYENMKPFDSGKASLDNLVDFYTYGSILDKFFQQDKTNTYKYIVSRCQLNTFFKFKDIIKVFIAVAGLGNGKTVFCQMIRQELRRYDIDVYTYQETSVDIESEIAAICQRESNKKCVVIIDDYNKHLDVMQQFANYGCDNIIFLLTTRRSAQEINYRKLLKMLSIKPQDIKPLYLDDLTNEEEKQLAYVLVSNNLVPNSPWKEDIKKLESAFFTECNDHMSMIVIYIFDHSHVKEKIVRMFHDALSADDNSLGRLCMLGLANSSMRLGLKYSDMLSLLDIDYLLLSRGSQESVLGDVFSFEEDEFRLASSAITSRILDDLHDEIGTLVAVLSEVVQAADKRSPTRVSKFKGNVYRHDRYSELIKAILSHSNFERFISKDSTNINIVKTFYENVRHTTFCQSNPFYWEQYAIIQQKGKDYETARLCLKYAYEIAKGIPAFVPFQIATIEAGLNLEILLEELQQKGFGANSAIDSLKKCHELLTKYYSHPDNNPIKVLTYASIYVKVYDEIKDKVDKRMCAEYINIASDMLKRIHDFKNEEKDSSRVDFDKSVEAIICSLEDAKKRIKKI